MTSTTTTKLTSRVRSALERNDRISHDDGRELFAIRDIMTLAKLARVPHERRHGRRAAWRDAWVAEYRGEPAEAFVAGLDAAAPADAARAIVRCRWKGGEGLATWKERLAAFGASRLKVTAAISPGFVVRMAAFDGRRPASVLEELAALMPLAINGEEAELFDDGFRADHAPGVISVDEWCGVHRAAHALGLRTTAAMTYTTTDRPTAYAHHLDAIRTLQDETGGFDAFAPLALHNPAVAAFHLAAPTAAQTLRMLAISRIFLDNIDHIAAAPALVTLEVAIVGLSYGADLIDTTIALEDLHSDESLPGSDVTLPVLDAAAAPFGAVSSTIVRERIEEARWTPVVVA